MKKVHIIPHMHWDREWYFSTEESRILLVNNMAEIMEMLETHPEYPSYILDGQTAILEDYFEICPAEKERVKRLVADGRLIIGPWYTQTDEMVVGGESIVRNLFYGMKDSAEFGEPMKIGYLPDSFGQSGQMPQILNGFDIHYTVFWRGTSERHGTDKTEFYWESQDGSKVLVQLLPLGYAIGKYLPEEESQLQERLDKYFKVLDYGTTSNQLILPNGHDQMPIQQNIFTIIEKLEKLYPEREFFLSRYENVFEILAEETGLATLQGEFIDGKYSRVHRSIFSTRMDIKTANTRIENKISNILEPLASIAYTLGFPYQHGLIEAIWKEIMKNHAHDSIGCCCSDKVHGEIMARFNNAEERTDRLIDFYKRKIVEAIPVKVVEGIELDKLTLFNLVPQSRNEAITTTIISKLTTFKLIDGEDNEVTYEILGQRVIDPGLIDRQIVHYGNYDPFIEYTIQFKRQLPAMGYEALFIQKGEAAVIVSQHEKSKIITDCYEITAETNGTLTILDRNSGINYQDVFNLENVADDGDEYDFSPLAGDIPIYSKDSVVAMTKMQQTKHQTEIQIKYDFSVPVDLVQRQTRAATSKIEVELLISVANDSPTLQIQVNLVNQAKDQRLRLLIPTGIAASCSYADNQFGVVKRDVEDAANQVWETEEWDERPDTIYPFLQQVSLSDGKQTVAVFTNSSREYQVIGEYFDVLAITLFRGVGVLGKENLVRRPGRPSGIKLPTPDSQMLGAITLELGLRIEAQGREQANLGQAAKSYLTPITVYNQIPYNAMKLNKSLIIAPTCYSLFSQKNQKIVLSTLKKAEADEALLLRFYNPSKGREEIQLSWQGTDNPIFQQAKLNEQLMAETSMQVRPNQVISLIKIAPLPD